MSNAPSSEIVVRMPRLADTLVEGTLGQWLKQVGQAIGRGEPLASIETDKATTELTSPAAGTLLEILVAEGQTVPIETPIARIGAAQSTSSASAAEAGAIARDAPTSPKPTPVAARLLKDHGLTPEQIPARSSRVTKDDVLAFVARPRPGSPAGVDDFIPLSPMRRAIADHMLEARRSIPHGQTVMAADLSRLVAWREQHRLDFQQQEGANLTYTVLFVYALARALAVHTSRTVDIGIAVAVPRGLIVPVLRSAEALTLGDTARGIAELAERARAHRLAQDEIRGADMTVSNVGSFGNLTAAPIIPLGQLGIFAPGLVEPRPLPGPDRGVRIGWQCLMCLMFDRRAVDDFAADRLVGSVITQLLSLIAPMSGSIRASQPLPGRARLPPDCA